MLIIIFCKIKSCIHLFPLLTNLNLKCPPFTDLSFEVDIINLNSHLHDGYTRVYVETASHRKTAESFRTFILMFLHNYMESFGQAHGN